MSEPFSMSALGMLALSEGIRFLYTQAGDVLRQWHRRRDARQPSGEEGPDLVPPEDQGLLASRLTPARMDRDAMAQVSDQLSALRQELTEYADGIRPVSPDNVKLLAAADGLRNLLEMVWQQPITFRGEQRSVTGPFVVSRLRVDEVMGRATGVSVDAAEAGTVESQTEAGTVGESGTLEGVRIAPSAVPRTNGLRSPPGSPGTTW